MRAVAIFRDRLLPASEVFILRQAESLSRYRPFYVGSIKTGEVETPPDRTFHLGGSRIREVIFKVTGRAPDLERNLQLARPALIHAHFGPDGVLAMPLARRLHLPLIVTFHGYDVTTADEHLRSSFHQRKYVRRRHLLANGSARIIAVSSFIAGRLREGGFPASKIVVHRMGVDLDLFTPTSLKGREPIVLFVGRLVEVKGCDVLIHAMSLLQENLPGVRLVIVGDGPLRSRLRALAASKRVKVSFEGTQPPTVVRDWMARAKVFCSPSVTSATGAEEGFGLAAVEAQAMGLPVVASRSGGIPEAVEDGATGFLEREGDWQAVARRMERLFVDEDIWSRYSEAARTRVRQLFDLRRQTRELERLYDDVLDEVEHVRDS